MRPTLPASLLFRLSELVAAQTGLYFPQGRWGDLERGIAAAAPDFNFSDVGACANWLLSAPLTRGMHEILASHLSVGETYFFREKQSLEIIGQDILPQLLESRREERRLRFWSAGCCTGEEAYSIAILLDRIIPEPAAWNITILATDFNPKFLRKAALGKYGEWSFRDAPNWLRERYFTKGKDGCYEIHPRIRKMVTFSYLNLAEDIYPSLSNNTSAIDVILCRNVMMYFTPQRTNQVVGNFYRALLEGGWLVVSPTEASNTLLFPFKPVEFAGAVLYRKSADAGLQPCASVLSVWQQPEAIEVPLAIAADVAIMAQAEPADAAAISELPPVQEISLQTGDSVIATRMARDCADKGKLGEAMDWCNKAIAADKLAPAHHYLSATILQEQGQHEAAIHALVRALYLDPDFVLAHFALGNLNQSQGRYREAQRNFGNVLLLLRNHPPGEPLPEADGLTAGRLAEIVASLLESLPHPATAAA